MQADTIFILVLCAGFVGVVVWAAVHSRRNQSICSSTANEASETTKPDNAP